MRGKMKLGILATYNYHLYRFYFYYSIVGLNHLKLGFIHLATNQQLKAAFRRVSCDLRILVHKLTFCDFVFFSSLGHIIHNLKCREVICPTACFLLILPLTGESLMLGSLRKSCGSFLCFMHSLRFGGRVNSGTETYRAGEMVLAVKSAYCPCRGTHFCCQGPHGNSKLKTRNFSSEI